MDEKEIEEMIANKNKQLAAEFKKKLDKENEEVVQKILAGAYDHIGAEESENE